MGRKGDYLFKRKGSDNFWLKLQWPKDLQGGPDGGGGEPLGKKIEMSMGTPDRAQALIKSYQQVAGFKNLIYLVRSWRAGLVESRDIETYAVEPGRMIHNQDGTRTFASNTEITVFGSDDKVISVSPNVSKAMVSLAITNQDSELNTDRQAAIKRAQSVKPPKVDTDKAIIDHWILMNNVRPAIQREAKEAFEAFKSIHNGKMFANSDIDDGIALAEYFFAKGNRRATVQKKIGHLRAAVHKAMGGKKFAHIKNNPFTNCVPEKKDDKTAKVELDDNDMRIMRENLHRLGANERLAFVLCATTGMRLGECWQFESEELIEGIRCVRTGHKNEASRRVIPLPAMALPYLPAKIDGPLFTDHEVNVGKNLNRAMHRFGIEKGPKSVHSTRHRASGKLLEVKDSVRWGILGHEDRNKPSEGYHRGHKMKTLLKAINLIGM